MQMLQPSAARNIRFTVSRARFDAVLFDLDGVITRTAAVHARAWKAMFDSFLQEWATQTGEQQPPFDLVTDYARYVDGLPRQQGAASFLASRGITLPQGQPEDPPQTHTLAALGNRKNALLLDLLRQGGVEVYATSVTLIRSLRRVGFRTAVVSSSKNCHAILAAAELLDLFDTQFDGQDLERLHLRGKPAPDAFLEAARRLGVVPQRAVVVEDAVAGVEAGHAGGFAMVIGVDRLGHADALAQAGATTVVQDLAEVGVA